MTSRYVALLRGINVGGNNLIKMADLKACFESLGAGDVSTFIASGNVLFEAPGEVTRLAAKLEAGLSKRFGYVSTLVIISRRALQAVVDERPKGFGAEPEKYKYDVLFLRAPATPGEVIAQVKPKEGVDRVWPGPGVVYFSRLIAKDTQSRLSKVVALPIYKSMTIRNWNTTRKLAELVSAEPAAAAAGARPTRRARAARSR